MRRLTLASGSPRRRELLQAACYDVAVCIPNADETWPGGAVTAAVVTLAQRKLARVGAQAGLVVAADTVVALPGGGEPLGKPRDASEAAAMLARLAGREHTVTTGYAIVHGTRHAARAVSTRVVFRALTSAEIDRYVLSGESFDKAGAYGIQGLGGALVAHVEGSYTNVVGLPLAEVLADLDALS